MHLSIQNCYNPIMPTIALTGNFGMGKTTVLKLFQKLGAHIFSSDAYVRDALKRKDIIKKVSKLLGGQVISISSKKPVLDKKLIAEIVFSDPLKRRALEKLIHPLVLRSIQTDMAKIIKKNSSAFIVFEVPLLFETGYEKYFDHTVTIFCSRRGLFERAGSKGFTRKEALKRLNAQMPISKKKALADFVIDNNGSPEKTEKRVKHIFNTIVNKRDNASN